MAIFTCFALFLVSTYFEGAVVVCEGTSTDIQCPTGRSISINSAFWGRADSQRCSRGLLASQLTLRVWTSGVVEKLRSTCWGASKCHVTADPMIFGDPRSANDSTPLYLIANFTCEGPCKVILVSDSSVGTHYQTTQYRT